MKAATGFPHGAPDLRRPSLNIDMLQRRLHRHLRRIRWL